MARVSLVLIACIVMGFFSGRGIGPYLPAAGWSFGLVGSFMLNHALKAERGLKLDDAGHLYALALVNCVVACVALFASGLGGMAASA